MKTNRLLCLLALSTMLFGCNKASNNDSNNNNVVQNAITLNATTISLPEEKTFQLEATVDPSLERYLLFWSSENENIATVDDNGLVTALKAGYTIIVAQVGKYFARCAVEVTNYVPADSLSVTFDKSTFSLNVDDTYELTPVVKLGNQIIEQYTVTSIISDDEVISYSNGLITALSAGNADLLLTYSYLEYSVQQLLHVAVY